MDGLIFAQTDAGAVLTGVTGAPVHAVVPARYQGQPVRAIGDYAFARQEQLQSVTLPDGIASIGSHAFYNCRGLSSLRLCRGVRSVDDGAFKNCKALRRISMRGSEYVKQLLSDFPYALTLTMALDDGQTAVLLFPEYDYEFLESVPPREFRSVTYGSGSFYRMCVSNKAVDFAQYDQTFARAAREDEPETVQRIAFLRLLYPYHLSGIYRRQYLAYLSEHAQAAVETVLRLRDIPCLELLLSQRLLEQHTVERAISLASQMDFPEAVSLLMDHRLARFGARRRRFTL